MCTIVQFKEKERVRSSIKEVLGVYDYTEVQPAFFEAYDEKKQVSNKSCDKVKVIHPSGTLKVLRPDATTSLIKMVKSLELPRACYRLSYDCSVFKYKSFKEIETIRKIGVEKFGGSKLEGNIEVLKMICAINNDVNQVLLVISDTTYLSALLNDLTLTEDMKNSILDTMAKKDVGTLRKQLVILDADEQILKKLIQILEENNLDELSTGYMNKEMKLAVVSLGKLIDGVKEKFDFTCTIDLSLVGDHDYYEGLIFKCYHNKLAEAFLRGGRYTEKTEDSEKIHAVGFSLDFEPFYRIQGGDDD